MEQIELQAINREILGRKVRFLRRQGIIPVHLFGHNVESLALQCEAAQLQRVLAQAGKTRLINLKLDKAKRPRIVVIREIHRDPLTSELLHVDFYQVRMAEKIKVELQELSNLTIECFPDQIPASVEVDLSSLTEAEQAIRVKDVVLDEEITVLNAPELIVVKISWRPRVEVVEEIVAEEVAEVPEEAPLPEEEPKEE